MASSIPRSSGAPDLETRNQSIPRKPVARSAGRVNNSPLIINPATPLPASKIAVSNTQHVQRQGSASPGVEPRLLPSNDARLTSRSGTVQQRVAIKASAAPPSYRPNNMMNDSSRRLPPSTTPSLVSGSSLSVPDSPTSVLRRHPTPIDRNAVQPRLVRESHSRYQQSSSSIPEEAKDDPFTGTVLGISLPPTTTSTSRNMKGYRQDSSSLANEKPARLAAANQPTRLPVLTTRSPRTLPSEYSMPSNTPETLKTTASSMSSKVAPEAETTRHIDVQHMDIRGRKARPEQHPHIASLIKSPSSPKPEIPRKDARRPSPRIESLPTKAIAPRGVGLPHSPAAFLTTRSRFSEPRNRDSTEVITPVSHGVPPEFAHLQGKPSSPVSPISPVSPLSPSVPFSPRRPSRDGTGDLSDYQKVSPIIQSNLSPHFKSYHKRKSSAERHIATGSPVQTKRLFGLGLSSRSSSRQESLRADSAMSPTPTSGTFSDRYHWETPAQQGLHFRVVGSSHISNLTSPNTASESRVGILPSPSTISSPRFGVMPRRNATPAMETEDTEKTKKRGPAAGTGHEGYGRFGFRGRASSMFRSKSRERSSSRDSSRSTRSFRSLRNLFTSSKKNSVSSDRDVSDDNVGDEHPSSVLRDDGTSSELSHRTIEDDSDRSSLYGDVNARTAHFGRSPSPESRASPAMSYDTTRTREPERAMPPERRLRHEGRSDQYSRSTQTSTRAVPPVRSYAEGKEGHWLRSGTPELRTKPSKGTTILQRLRIKESTANLRSATPSSVSSTSELRANYASVKPARALEPRDTMQSLKESKHARHQPPTFSDSQANKQTPVPYGDRHESGMPSPITEGQSSSGRKRRLLPQLLLRTESTESPRLLHAETATLARSAHLVDIPRTPATPRNSISRLSPVGRIPAVVQSDKPDRQSPTQSYSRPLTESTHEGPVRDGVIEVDGTQFAHVKSPRSSGTAVRGDSREARTAKDSKIRRPATPVGERSEAFIAFPVRKNSDLSYTSSSGMASPCCSTVPTMLGHGEDDVWGEYNDLLDDVLPNVSAGSADAARNTAAHKAVATDTVRKNMHTRLPVPSMAPRAKGKAPALPQMPRAMEEDEPSRFSRFLQPVTTPTTPFSISDYLMGYPESSEQMADVAIRHSAPMLANLPKVQLNRLSLPTYRHSRPSKDTKRSPIIESSDSALGSADTTWRNTGDIVDNTTVTPDLSFAALMTSRWLSFGRVLFSPAHNEARNGDAKILVVDGLGTDWSYYCAETYPQSQFYNLGPGIARSTGTKLSNHHLIPYPSTSAPFPFPRGFFTAVVFRFPLITSEAIYQTIIAECRRVLRSGGYLELSVLDLDLMNMGHKARKAIMDLKIRIHRANKETSLWNQGDTFMKHLGKQGWDNIQRCVVGLPAAGTIPKSAGCSSSSGDDASRRGSILEDNSESYMNLLHNESKGNDNERDDEHITKMVAKVGRWWYSTCYESGIRAAASTINAQPASIWATSGLLREMNCQGTSLRLLICYAQKPVDTRRRTISV